MSFRENLKSELTFQGILVKELSLKTGINKRTLDNYLREKGNIPSADIAVKIANALNVSVEYLVTGKERQQDLEASGIFTPEIRLIAKKLSKMNVNQRRLVSVLVNELENQMASNNNTL